MISNTGICITISFLGMWEGEGGGENRTKKPLVINCRRNRESAKS